MRLRLDHFLSLALLGCMALTLLSIGVLGSRVLRGGLYLTMSAAAIVRAHHGRIGASPSPLGGLRVVVGLARDPHAE
jgi:hypothetical protein